MTPNEIADALARHADAKNRHDVDAILQTCADDFFYESVALGQRVEGREELRRFYEALFSGLPDYYGEFDGTAIGDDTAVVWGRWGGTLSGNFMGAAVEPGREIEIPVTFVCTFRDGLITSDRAYFDTATLTKQLGTDDQTADYVTRFEQFWSDPAGDLVPELVRPDALVSWPGIETFSGADYPAHMDRVLQLLPDLRLEVTDHATNGATAFISWRARATVGAAPMEWTGTDRVVVRDGRSAVVEVSYDTAPISQALEHSAHVRERG
jgi:steroid delta-isomerase-like uncharacterized protein